jgi:hypothetical protein
LAEKNIWDKLLHCLPDVSGSYLDGAQDFFEGGNCRKGGKVAGSGVVRGG